MKTNRSLSVLAVTALLGAAIGGASCAKPGKRTAIGAGAGAAGGAIGGAVIGGKKGALIGAGVGAVAGTAGGNYLDNQAEELEKVAETKRTKDGILVNLKNDLLFPTGSAVLNPSATDQLTRLGDVIAKYEEDRVEIEGFTDSRGTASFNEELSERRADAVREVLVSRGVKPSQMLVRGKGEQEPVASNASESGRRKNRRVELHITVPSGEGQA
jgi:outer membrane protein OmpA-like peptidoglycan-associated protein